MKCSECQNEIPEGSVFCPVCGSAQFEAPVEETLEPVAEVKEEVAPVAEEPKPVKKKKKWWILAAAAAAVLAVVAALVIFVRPQTAYGVYSTSEGLFLTDLSGGEPVRLAGDIRLRRLFMTKDEKRLFFEEGDDFSRGGLYYLDLQSDSKEPVMLAKDISGLYVNDRGTGLAYIREGNLYVHDLESETLIAQGVVEFLCDEGIDTFAFAKTTTVTDSNVERTWYFQDGNREPMLVGDGRKGVRVLSLSANGKKMIYTGDGGIYAWKNGKETVIAENATLTGFAYEDMTFYYRWVNEAGQAAVCFYNGKRSVEITDDEDARASGEQQMLRWKDDESGHSFVAIRDRVLEIPLKDVMRAELSEDGRKIYVTTQGEDNKRDLYAADISWGKVGKMQLLAENAADIRLTPLGKRLYYWVSSIGRAGDLYCDGERILRNVESYIQVHQETGTLLAREEVSYNNTITVNLYMVRDGKAMKLMDENGGMEFATNGDVLVVTEKGELWCFDQNGTGRLLADNARTVYPIEKFT